MAVYAVLLSVVYLATSPEMTVGRQANYLEMTIVRQELNRPPAAYIRVGSPPPHYSFTFLSSEKSLSALFAFA